MDLAVSLLMIVASFLGMLWLLLFWFGEGHARMIVPYLDGSETADLDEPETGQSHPFIPMPKHLRTHDEMIAWMTQELPRLTAENTNPRL